VAEISSDLVVESYKLTKIYQNRQIALNDVTLKLEPGSVLGLLGQNGAGMDATDPEPLPDNSPLWSMTNVVISPHLGGQSDGARDRQWRLFRENIRRFVAGEPLLCVVNKQKGF